MLEKKDATGGKPAAAGLSSIGHSAQPDNSMNSAATQAQSHNGARSDFEAMLNGNFHTDADLQTQRLAQTLGKPDPGAKILWTAGELLRAQFPDPIFAVPKLVPAGLTNLAGRPKIGKSWLGLQMGIAVGTGGQVLGEQVEKRPVLYLALEDSKRRLQDRLKLQGCPEDASLTLLTEFPTLAESGLEHLQGMISTHGYTFVIIDTLARFAPVRKPEDEATIGKRLAELQQFALERNIAVLLIDHHRKAGASSVQDLIDDVMGATSKTGIADAVLGLYRARGQQGAELKLTGRDVAELELAVHFDKQLFCWQLLGDAAGVKANTLQAEVIATLTDTFGGEVNCTDLARFLQKDKSNIRKELLELVDKGRLIKSEQKKGKEVLYRLPQEPIQRERD